MRVRVNSKYRFEPVLFDKLNPPAGSIKEGDTVRVVNLHGAPKANTMGMCYVNDLAGNFGGMVMTNSLVKI
jgi:hypothetical protein